MFENLQKKEQRNKNGIRTEVRRFEFSSRI